MTTEHLVRARVVVRTAWCLRQLSDPVRRG